MTELTIDQALQQGIEAHKAGQVQEADRLYTAILKAQPRHPDANHNLGVLAVGVGKVEQALPFFKTALEANPAIGQFWLSYIDTLIKLDKFADAKAVLDQAKSKGAKGDGFDKLEQRLKEVDQGLLEANQIASEPQPKQANILDTLKLDQAISLAKKKAKDGSPEEAKRIYQDILAKFTKNKRASDGLKRLTGKTVGKASKVQEPPQDQVQSLIKLHGQGKLQQALKQAESLVQQFPRSAVVFNIQGAVFKSLGQLDQSIKAYNKALAIKPDYAEAYQNKGIALQNQGNLSDAVNAYKNALALRPESKAIYQNLGASLRQQGRLQESIEIYQKALALDPNNFFIYNNLANSFKDQGKLKDSIKAYTAALKIKPDDTVAVENFLSLKTQLQKTSLITDKIQNNATAGSSLAGNHRPKFHVLNAISSFLSSDQRQTAIHLQNYNDCTHRTLGVQTSKDWLFCNSYSNYLDALLKTSFEDKPDFEVDKLIYHIGESHCLSYAHRKMESNGLTYRIVPMITFGAKAFHFSQRNNNLFKMITHANLDSLPKRSNVFLSFGEIDCRPNEGFISASAKLNVAINSLIWKTLSGYLQWIFEKNKVWEHTVHLFNIPAPNYDTSISAKMNADVANTVTIFNSEIAKLIVKYGFSLIDVYRFTLGQNEFSNGRFHIDNKHLGPKAISEIEQQLNN